MSQNQFEGCQPLGAQCASGDICCSGECVDSKCSLPSPNPSKYQKYEMPVIYGVGVAAVVGLVVYFLAAKQKQRVLIAAVSGLLAGAIVGVLDYKGDLKLPSLKQESYHQAPNSGCCGN